MSHRSRADRMRVLSYERQVVSHALARLNRTFGFSNDLDAQDAIAALTRLHLNLGDAWTALRGSCAYEGHDWLDGEKGAQPVCAVCEKGKGDPGVEE